MLHMLPGREMAGHLEARVKRQHDLFHVVRLRPKNSTKELVIFFFVCSAAVQLPSPTEPDQMSPKVLSFLPVF